MDSHLVCNTLYAMFCVVYDYRKVGKGGKDSVTLEATKHHKHVTYQEGEEAASGVFMWGIGAERIILLIMSGDVFGLKRKEFLRNITE